MRGIGHARRLLAAGAAVLAVACADGTAPAAPTAPPSAAAADTQRARLLGALPPDEAARGVYVVDLARAGDLSPGSRLAPVVAPLADDADVLVETNAPPVTLLGGVAEDVAIADPAVRVGDVVVVAHPDVREAVVARLAQGAAPAGALAELAAADAPVGWAGPTPAPQGSGTTVITLSPEHVRFAVSHDLPQDLAEAHANGELAQGGPVGSPGKRWPALLERPRVTHEGGRLVVAAVPVDLPGLLLRVLVDQRQVAFLPG